MTCPGEAEVRALLNEIIDPCSEAAGAPAGLDEMGLVEAIGIQPGPRGASVTVVIGLTQPACLMGIVFARTAEERLRELPGVAAVDVSLASGIDWTPDRISPEYARRLAEVRRRRGVLNPS